MRGRNGNDFQFEYVPFLRYNYKTMRNVIFGNYYFCHLSWLSSWYCDYDGHLEVSPRKIPKLFPAGSLTNLSECKNLCSFLICCIWGGNPNVILKILCHEFCVHWHYEYHHQLLSHWESPQEASCVGHHL